MGGALRDKRLRARVIMTMSCRAVALEVAGKIARKTTTLRHRPGSHPTIGGLPRILARPHVQAGAAAPTGKRFPDATVKMLADSFLLGSFALLGRTITP